MLAVLVHVKHSAFQSFITPYISTSTKVSSSREERSCTTVLFAACPGCLYIKHDIFVLQKLLNGPKQGDLDAVDESLAKEANVDVGVSLRGSILIGFL